MNSKYLKYGYPRKTPTHFSTSRDFKKRIVKKYALTDEQKKTGTAEKYSRAQIEFQFETTDLYQSLELAASQLFKN